ncbi:hypothetical protein [Luteimonas pelagia]
MKTTIRVLFAALLATTVVACQDKEADEAAAAAAAAKAPLSAPTDPADEAGWQAYVTDVVRRNLGDVTNSPYVYYLPATAESGADATAADDAEAGAEAGADATAAAGGEADAGADQAATLAEGSSDYARLLDKAKEDIARGILPGNMLAFASPDSSVAGDLAVAAFEGVEADAMKGVRVLFIGEAADGERVRTAVGPSGVTYVFVEAK